MTMRPPTFVCITAPNSWKLYFPLRPSVTKIAICFGASRPFTVPILTMPTFVFIATGCPGDRYSDVPLARSNNLSYFAQLLVISFIKYWRSPCQAGKLLRIAVAWTQHSVGTSTSFLLDTTTKLPHMESKWLYSLREFLRYIKGHLELDHTYVPKPECVHDYFIMEAVLQSGELKDDKDFNYLQAVTISDLTQANGENLDDSLLEGNPSRWSSVSKWHHVTQAKPSLVQWNVWRRANRLWSNSSGKLHQPLRRWRHPAEQQRRTWMAYGDWKGTIYMRNTSHPVDNGTDQLIASYTRYTLDIPGNDSIYYEVPMSHLA